MRAVRAAVVAAPDAAALVLLALALPISLAVTIGVFTPWLVLPGALVALAAVWRLRPASPVASPPMVWGSVAAVAGSVGWALVQLRLTGEYVTVDRDPAVYALTGIWLIDHTSVAVPMTEAATSAEGIPGARTAGLGFGASADPLSPEFTHTVPGLVAVAGWLGGTTALLKANVLVAAAALVALYSATRRVLGPWWALVPPVALGLAMPFVGFARSVYSEPLSMALTAGGISALVVVFGLGATDSARRPALLAGLFFGGVGVVRVDGGLLVAGAIAAVGLWSALAAPARRLACTALVSLTGPAVALVGLGLLDVAWNSGNYLDRHRGEVAAVLILLLAVLLASAAAIAWSVPMSTWVDRHRSRLGMVLASAVGVASMLLVSRRWWYEARAFDGSLRYQRDIQKRQVDEGLALDGARSYDELTLDWVAWYHGWPVVLLGLAGLSLLVYVAIVRRRYGLLAVLVPLGVPALLYLVRPSITPDHVWAMRRLVPAAVPLLLIAGSAALREVAGRRRPGWVLAAAGGVLALTWPLTTWSGLFEVRDRVGQLDEVAAACGQVSDGRVVLANGAPGVDYLPTMRIMCDAQVVQITPTTQQALADLRASWGGEPLTLITFDRDGMPWTRPPEAPAHEARLEMWERSLVDPPAQRTVWRRFMWSGTVLADGTVEPMRG